MGSRHETNLETELTAPQGNFAVQRYPKRQNERLRAWDAADEYLLNYVGQPDIDNDLSGLTMLAQRHSALVVNDSFGALAIALAADMSDAASLVSWSDSYLAHRALTANIENNEPGLPIRTVSGLDSPGDSFDLVLIKVPKSNSFLEDQLLRLRPCLSADTKIVAAGMVKHVHSSTLQIFERILGPTRTSLAKKKARLIHTKFDPTLTPPPTPWPVSWKTNGIDVSSYAGVFSAAKLDIGTRFLIDNLPTDLPSSADPAEFNLVDLGCGNGVIGTVAASVYPGAEPTFLDESYAAVASAERTFRSAFPERTAHFAVCTGLAEAANHENQIDVVVTNPPFHQNQAMTDAVAWDMFNDAHRYLADAGELWVVGNRHLGYHTKLKRVFGNCETIASNRKFVVLKSQKSKR